ncbi:MAG TPA: hypothetical protein VF398_07245 [bacterium]|jgi:hypothetical protein
MKRHFAVALALLILAGRAFADDTHGHEGAKTVSAEATITVTGQILDPVCFIDHGASGPDHRTCAQACANLGINLVFFNEKDNQIYNILPTGHANPNDKVVEFAEKHVEITGTIHKKPGYQAIEIQSIKELGDGQKISLAE